MGLISRTAQHALRALTWLAVQQDRVPVKDLADHIGTPQPYLARIVIQLAEAGYVGVPVGASSWPARLPISPCMKSSRFSMKRRRSKSARWGCPAAPRVATTAPLTRSGADSKSAC